MIDNVTNNFNSLFSSNDVLENVGISEDMLNNLSLKCSLGKSLNKLSVTPDILRIVISDVIQYNILVDLSVLGTDIDSRIKTPDSARRKVNRHPNMKFQSVFNDLLGLRIRVPDYNISIPSYFRVVDMSSGKSNDDGYRALHLYYKKDNYHYPIEIQLWSDRDYDFNNWSHMYAYKIASSHKLLSLREYYDNGLITSEYDFKSRLEEL